MEYSGTGGIPAFPREDNPRTKSIFIHTLNPGETVEEGVVVINNTEKMLTLLVFSSDPAATGKDGGFACATLAEMKKSTGTWINLKTTEVTLAPNANKTIPFTISIPEDAEVGEHNACINIQAKNFPTRKLTEGVRLTTSSGIRVAMTVPGEIMRELSISEFTIEPRPGGGKIFHIVAKNSGNISIDADINLVTRNILGKIIDQNGGEFPVLPNKSKDWNFDLPPTFWGGWYNAKLEIAYDKNPEVEIGENTEEKPTILEKNTVWFFMWPTTFGLFFEILVLFVILLNLFLLIIAIKRKRWVKNTWVDYKIKPSDNVRELAEKFSVSWKLLAKANKLKLPYVFKKGETIKVPPHSKS